MNSNHKQSGSVREQQPIFLQPPRKGEAPAGRPGLDRRSQRQRDNDGVTKSVGFRKFYPLVSGEPHCHPVRRTPFSGLHFLFRRGSAGGERARLRSCTCGSRYPERRPEQETWPPAAWPRDLAGPPEGVSLGWGVGCTEQTQASPVLYPSCCLFLYLLVLGSCSPHLPQDQGQTHLSRYRQRDRSEWPAPVSIAAVNRDYFCQELQRTVFQTMFITTVKGRTQLAEM